MQMTKRELISLILSVLLLFALGFIYLNFGRRQESSIPREVKIANVSTTAKNAKLELLKSKIGTLEKNPNTDDWKKLQAEVDQLEAGKDKETLVKRLAEVQVELDRINKAQLALTKAESTGQEEDIKAAQKAIDQLTARPKKTDFQKRLDALVAAIENQVAYIPPVDSEASSSSEVKTAEETASQETATEASTATETAVADTAVSVPTAPAATPTVVPTTPVVPVTPVTPVEPSTPVLVEETLPTAPEVVPVTPEVTPEAPVVEESAPVISE